MAHLKMESQAEFDFNFSDVSSGNLISRSLARQVFSSTRDTFSMVGPGLNGVDPAENPRFSKSIRPEDRT